jgi:hypothetical protein
MAANRRGPTFGTDPTISKRDYASNLDDEIVALWNGVTQRLASVSGSNTITASATPAVTAYGAGMCFLLNPAAVNTGAVTININAAGAKDIRDAWNTALIGGELDPDGEFPIFYDGTRFLLHPFVTMFRRGTLDRWQVVDGSGDSAIEVAPTGLVSFYPHALHGLGGRLVRARDWGHADDAGNVAALVDRSGAIVSRVAHHEQVGGVDMPALLRAQVPAPTFRARLYGFHIGGQSLALGSKGEPLFGSQAEFGALMFVGGVRASSDGVSSPRASWKGLEENLGADNKAETIASGLCSTFREIISVENRVPRSEGTIRCFASVSGLGSTAIASLDKGSATYTALMADVQGGYDIADAAGLSYVVPAFPWLQGEADVDDGTTPSTYKTLLTTLQSDFQTDTKAITGQTGNIPLLMYQVASHKYYSVTDPAIARAQQEVFESSSLVVMVAPGYIFDYADRVHLADGPEYRRLGAYYGWYAKRIEIDGEAPANLKPLAPTAHVRTSTTIELTFRTRYGGLRLDFDTVRDNTYDDVLHGFELFEADGTTPIPLASVEVWPPASAKLLITVAAGETVPANAVLQYAHKGEGTTGRIDGPRGNLRDEQGESQIFNGFPIHNFAPIFRRTIT